MTALERRAIPDERQRLVQDRALGCGMHFSARNENIRSMPYRGMRHYKDTGSALRPIVADVSVACEFPSRERLDEVFDGVPIIHDLAHLSPRYTYAPGKRSEARDFCGVDYFNTALTDALDTSRVVSSYRLRDAAANEPMLRIVHPAIICTAKNIQAPTISKTNRSGIRHSPIRRGAPVALIRGGESEPFVRLAFRRADTSSRGGVESRHARHFRPTGPSVGGFVQGVPNTERRRACAARQPEYAPGPRETLTPRGRPSRVPRALAAGQKTRSLSGRFLSTRRGFTGGNFKTSQTRGECHRRAMTESA